MFLIFYHHKFSYPVIVLISEARKNGYVKTILGRRRYLPDISLSDPSKRAQAERQAVNSVVQVGVLLLHLPSFGPPLTRIMSVCD